MPVSSSVACWALGGLFEHGNFQQRAEYDKLSDGSSVSTLSLSTNNR
jgi:hypothetical protein